MYDPLISWRLLKTTKQATGAGSANTVDMKKEKENRRRSSGAFNILNATRNSPAIGSRPEGYRETYQDSLMESDSEAANTKALAVLARVESKLQGRDFSPVEELDVPSQVEELIRQATSHVNLCQCYVGWCPFW